MGIITIYRPPNCNNDEFLSCLNNVEDWMNVMKTKKENIRFVMNDDFNMSFLKSWDYAVITDFLLKSTYKMETNFP